MTRLSSAQFATIVEVNQRRSQGQWTIDLGPDSGDRAYLNELKQRATIKTTQDLEFICMASWAIPALLLEVHALRAELDEKSRQIESAIDALGGCE